MIASMREVGSARAGPERMRADAYFSLPLAPAALSISNSATIAASQKRSLCASIAKRAKGDTRFLRRLSEAA